MTSLRITVEIQTSCIFKKNEPFGKRKEKRDGRRKKKRIESHAPSTSFIVYTEQSRKLCARAGIVFGKAVNRHLPDVTQFSDPSKPNFNCVQTQVKRDHVRGSSCWIVKSHLRD